MNQEPYPEIEPKPEIPSFELYKAQTDRDTQPEPVTESDNLTALYAAGVIGHLGDRVFDIDPDYEDSALLNEVTCDLITDMVADMPQDVLLTILSTDEGIDGDLLQDDHALGLALSRGVNGALRLIGELRIQEAVMEQLGRFDNRQ